MLNGMICLFGLAKAITDITTCNSVISCAHIFISIRTTSKQLAISILPITRETKTYKPHLFSGTLNSCAQLNYTQRLKSRDTCSEMLNNLPFFASGEIVQGFGRGSKELGIPTANYPLEIVKSLPPAFQTGVYYGWANVDNSEVYKMVMSVGWNPFYNNTERSMETHILHDFNRDLYGCLLKVCIIGYLRTEQNFSSLEELKAAINNDIELAKVLLDADEENQNLKNSKFFRDNTNDVKNNIQQNEVLTENLETKPKNRS